MCLGSSLRWNDGDVVPAVLGIATGTERGALGDICHTRIVRGAMGALVASDLVHGALVAFAEHGYFCGVGEEEGAGVFPLAGLGGGGVCQFDHHDAVPMAPHRAGDRHPGAVPARVRAPSECYSPVVGRAGAMAFRARDDPVRAGLDLWQV